MIQLPFFDTFDCVSMVVEDASHKEQQHWPPFLSGSYCCRVPDPLNAAHTVPSTVIIKYCMLKPHTNI